MSSPGDNGENKETKSDDGESTSPKVEPSDYVVVQDDEGGEPMELPVNKEDNSLGLSTLSSAFPGSHGLKFKNPKTGASRALMMDGTGTKFMSPPDGWENKVFTVIFPPSRGGAGEAKRRKVGDGSDSEEDEGAAKQKRLDDKPTDLICLGVNFTTDGETFKKHFEQFGTVVSADLKLNYEGKSKGFGFVLMSTLEEQDKVVNHERHEIDGRRVEVKVPDARSENFRNPLLPREQSTNKVFVGRLPETTTDELRAFFEAEAKKLNPHANITDCFLPRPFRGFGFVTFSTCEMARKICVANNFSMKGAPLAVSLAVPRDDPSAPPLSGGRGGPPMRGGPADRYGGQLSSYGGGGSPYGYGYGGGRDFGLGGGSYDEWQSPRYEASWEGAGAKSPNRPMGGRGGPSHGTPPSHHNSYGSPAGPVTPGSNYGTPNSSRSNYGPPNGGSGTPSYGGSGSGGYGSAQSGGNYGGQMGQSLSMALAGNIPGMGLRPMGGGGGPQMGQRMNGGGGGGPQPLNAQPAPASLATGLDALNLNRNNNPEVFSAAWAVFMNTLKNGGNQGPNQPPPQRHPGKW